MKRNWLISRWLKKLFSSAKPVPNRRRKTARLGLERLEERWLPSALFTVTDNGDTGLATQLRAAIIASNNPATGATAAAPNTIGFNIGGGVQTITLLQGVLPTLTEPVIINGFSETAGSTTPQIELNGNGGAFSGLTVGANGAGSDVQGLAIGNFGGNGVVINASSVTLVGNYIGTDLTGATALANRGDGVLLENGAAANTIGGTASGAGNVLSGAGNGISGVEINGSGTSGNLVAGNLIGTDIHGTAALAGSFQRAVTVRDGATNNRVSGTTTGVTQRRHLQQS